jgi:hypothetical protein
MHYGMHRLDGHSHDAPPVVAFLAASSRHAVLGKSSLLLPHNNRVVQPHPLNVGPNAAPQPLPEAGARHERTLEAVGCRRLLGADSTSGTLG